MLRTLSSPYKYPFPSFVKDSIPSVGALCDFEMKHHDDDNDHDDDMSNGRHTWVIDSLLLATNRNSSKIDANVGVSSCKGSNICTLFPC